MDDLQCRLLHASHLAYSTISADGKQFEGKDVDAEMKLIQFDPASIRIFQSPHDDDIDACYYGETTVGEAILAFRGTLPPTLDLHSVGEFFEILLDWLNDAKMELIEGSGLPGMVHKGFFGSLQNLWGFIAGLDLGMVAQRKRLYITGHSKGGALAVLAACRLVNEQIVAHDKLAGVYTYAAPRAGDGSFGNAYANKLGLDTLTRRFEYQDDIVPHLPPHTALWFDALDTVAVKFPGSALQDAAVHDNVKRLAARLTELKSSGFPGYVSVGVLNFINWDKPPEVVGDSARLSLRRELHLAELLLTLQIVHILEDHSSSGGYMSALCATA